MDKSFSFSRIRPMQVSFRNRTLQERYEDANKGTRAWGPQVARRYIQRINQIEAMPTFDSLFSLRSLRFHPLKGNRQGQYALTIVGRYRLIVEQTDASDTVLVSEVSNHYGD